LTHSINADRGMDFQLKLLGIDNRAEWTIDARDTRIYHGDVIYGRPDWVIRHVNGRRLAVYDYKNRYLADGDATDYEKFQAILHGILVTDAMKKELGFSPDVDTHLLYADNRCLEVEYGLEEVDLIGNAISEVGTALYFLGVLEEPRLKVSVTNVARYLVDPTFSNPAFGRTAAQRAGSRAHELLLRSGPTFH
jgi:hypothetical protein